MSRLLRLYTLALFALAFLGLGTVRQAAASPVVTNVMLSTVTALPVDGGTINVSATVTDSAAINGVKAYIYRNGVNSYNENVVLSNGGSGNVYTGTFASDGANTGTSPDTYAVNVAAADASASTTSGLSNTISQPYDNTPPIITNVGISATNPPLTVQGGQITITATVTDPANRMINQNGVKAYIYRNGVNSYNENVVLSNGGSGNVYTGTFASDGANTGTSPDTYAVNVAAANDLNLTRTSGFSNTLTQPNYDTHPTITGATLSPETLPAAGGIVTITATVTAASGRTISIVVANVNGSNYSLSSGGSGNIYTHTIQYTSGGSSTGTVTATDDLGLSTMATLNGTQGTGGGGTSSPPPSLSTTNPVNPVLNPSVVAAGGSDLPLTITGSGFANGATVLFNGVTLTPASVTPTQITFTVPAALVAGPGAFAVTVVTPGNGSAAPSNTSNGVNLNVVAPAPAVTLYELSYQDTYYTLTYSPTQAASFVASGWAANPTGHVYANATDAPGLTPLYRLYAPSNQDHFFTTDPSQRASLIASGSWQDKGIACYVYPTQVSGTMPLYKALNTQTNLHLFTGSAAQYNALTPPWSLRGPAAYILP